MNENMELTQIVKIVQEDIEQFELLYSKIINKVYFWCYTIARDETTAKDMSQEAMIRIYNKFDTLTNPETFNSWMYQLVRNSCITYLRNNKKHTTEMLYSDDFDESFEDNIQDERSDNSPDEAYSLSETKELIKSFVDKLPRKQREVITLYYLEEFKTTEIADILNYKVVSVRGLLHLGRKNLEQQINDYQEKNNVKLYSAILLPLLGLILSEYQSDICSRQKLQYEKSMYSASNRSFLGKLSQFLTSKIGIFITAIIFVSVIVAVVASIFQNQPIDNKAKLEASTSMMNDVAMYNKSKGHPYIKDITYLEFPMREGVEVKIELKKDITKEDIKVLYNDEELSFEKNEKDILVQVKENGIYTIVIKNDKIALRIHNIDVNAPELVGIIKKEGYLLLVVNDEQSKIDYEKSFMEYQNKQYKISENLKINGEFNKKVKVTIFHRNGYKITYDIDLK